MDKQLWTIVGGGSGGLAIAGYLGMNGFKVNLLTQSEDVIKEINKNRGIKLTGLIEGIGKVNLVTNNPKDALSEASVVMVVLPANYHEATIERIGPYLEKGQILFLHPGMTLGILATIKKLQSLKINLDDITVAEAQTLVYACRKSGPSSTRVYGIKKEVPLATYPKNKLVQTFLTINDWLPHFSMGENMVSVGLGNINAMLHPAPTVLNLFHLESNRSWRYFVDGFTPTISNFVENLDQERVELGKAFGENLPSLKEFYKSIYGATKDSLHGVLNEIEAYRELPGPLGLNTRYITEDIPFGLVPMFYLAEKLNTPNEYIQTTIMLASKLFEVDYFKSGRNLGKLGIEGLSKEEIIELCTS